MQLYPSYLHPNQSVMLPHICYSGEKKKKKIKQGIFHVSSSQGNLTLSLQF